MAIPRIETSPQLYARIAGLLYLAIIGLGLFGEAYVRETLVIPGDAAATARAITAQPLLWRAGVVGDLLMHVCDLPVILVLYLLLRPVSGSLAVLATLVNLVQTAVLALNKLSLLAPLVLLGNATWLEAFTTQQREALAYLAINLHGKGFGIGLVFFGFACLIRGALIFASGFLPRALGVLMAVAGACYLANSFALFLAPALASAIFPGILAPAFVAELALASWLVAKGVDRPAWDRRMAPAQGAPATA